MTVLGHAAPSIGSVPVGDDTEEGTRERVLRLIVEDGPVSVVELARDLDLTPAGLRRHVVALEADGRVEVHEGRTPGGPRRGRPARRWVATSRGQAGLATSYAGIAALAVGFLAEIGGPDAVQAFADRRAADLAARLDLDPEGDLLERVTDLAAALGAEGYAATVRPMPGGHAVQLCQGHCPVRDVAARYPELCEAETHMLSELLGVHVQRLATLAAGDHVCTTHIPLGQADAGRARPQATEEGTR